MVNVWQGYYCIFNSKPALNSYLLIRVSCQSNFLCKVRDGNQCKKQRCLHCHCYDTRVFCPFGRAEPVKMSLGLAAAGETCCSWYFWCQAHVAIAKSLDLENTDKMLMILCSENDEQISFTVCSSQCWVSTVWWNLEVPVEHLLFTCCAPEARVCCSFGSAWAPRCWHFSFSWRKKSFSLLTRGGFLSLLCEEGLLLEPEHYAEGMPCWAHSFGA